MERTRHWGAYRSEFNIRTSVFIRCYDCPFLSDGRGVM